VEKRGQNRQKWIAIAILEHHPAAHKPGQISAASNANCPIPAGRIFANQLEEINRRG
jgi:hypothetical protein